MDNLQHDVVKLQSAMEGLGITAFNQVGGKMRGLVGIATEAVGKIDEKLASGKGIEKAVDKIEAMVEKANHIGIFSKRMQWKQEQRWAMRLGRS